MKRWLLAGTLVCAIAGWISLPAQQPPAPKKKGGQLPPIEATPEQRQRMQAKLDELDAALKKLTRMPVKEPIYADVEVYSKAGHWLLDFPGFFDQQDIANALTVLDRGLERATQLQNKESPWVAQKGRKIHGFHSELDGSVQPYGVTIPESYDGSRPVPLYVWLHGRNARLTEASFIYNIGNPIGPNSTAATADLGQITIDVYGRGNNANHWAGEVDIFEAMADVQKRYKIDPKRIVLRGFSLGGAAAWHVALQHPDSFVAAEIGAGTWPRRATMASQYPPYQAATLLIWENIIDWSLNAFNIPIAGHDGDMDTQVASIPPPTPGTPTRGQLESSIKVREQLAKEGFPSEGEPNAMVAKGSPAVFYISANTGHGVSPEVRKKLDVFLKQWVDRGQSSPDHVRFLTYTTRYNHSYWVSIDGMEKHYQRAEVDAQRSSGKYKITTKNVSRLTLRETADASEFTINGQTVKIKRAGTITLEKLGRGWRQANAQWAGLHKTHKLQGPIDDAFLDPYLLVQPTGTPWNADAHRAALQAMERFDKAYARNYRAHPRVKRDTEITEADFGKYNVVLFGDPGSNKWIGKLLPKLPIRWTKEQISVGSQNFPAAQHYPALIYPSPPSPSHYVVINSGLTIDEREYNSDYSMPKLGDIAVLKAAEGPPEIAWATLFDESWRLPQ